MMRDARISLVTLGVDDLGRAAAFYEALGWTRTAAGNESVIFLQGEGMVLSLFGRQDLAADVGRPAADSAPSPCITLAVNVASAAEVDRLYGAALSAGAVAVKPPAAVFWGGYSGYVADPDGHLWELAHNPFFAMTATGQIDLLSAPEGPSPNEGPA
jgi:uncharacterized protein